MTTPAHRPRYTWMYSMRGLAILMVVFHHATSSLTRFSDGAPELLLTIDDAISPFRMPALMFISGMLLSRSLKKSPREYFTGKLAGIGWPYLLWSVIVLLILGELTINNILGIVFVPPTGYWYLWFLLAYYVIAFVLQKVPRPYLIAGALILAAVAPGFIRADRFCFLFAFFIAGDWAMRTRDRWMPYVSKPWVLTVAAILAVGTGWLATSFPVRYEVISAPGVVGAIVLAVALLPKLDNTPVARPIQYVGENSLIYYVVHWPAMALAAQLVIPVTGLSGYGLFTFELAIGLLAATAFALASHRFSPVDWLFRWPRRASRATLA